MHFSERLVNEFFLAGHDLPVAVDRTGRAARNAPAPTILRLVWRLTHADALSEANAQWLQDLAGKHRLFMDGRSHLRIL